jgi:glyoxalase family protein
MHTKDDITGIHHITAVASSTAENIDFYENVLGLRLVKQTVNFDDPFTYHLYYGDAQGAPGTILTFFPWQTLPRGKPGTGMVTAIAFAIPRSSMAFWNRRIKATGRALQTAERFGDPVITFADTDGLPIELVGRVDLPPTTGWGRCQIPDDHAIHGFHSATATLNGIEDIQALLEGEMGMRRHLQEGARYRFMMADQAAPGHLFDIVADPAASPGKPGVGTVHHIAFRTASGKTQAQWQSKLRQAGRHVTEVRDRKYFRSIYFHSPGGVLFEIATDPPGFTVDESVEDLGTALMLPDQYEPIRTDIEKRLPALQRNAFYQGVEDASASTEAGRASAT